MGWKSGFDAAPCAALPSEAATAAAERTLAIPAFRTVRCMAVRAVRMTLRPSLLALPFGPLVATLAAFGPVNRVTVDPLGRSLLALAGMALVAVLAALALLAANILILYVAGFHL